MQIVIDAALLPFETFKFPAGELHVKLKGSCEERGPILIKIRINSSDDLFELLLATDALRRTYKKWPISVFIPYIPYARQDRPMVEGEPFSLKVFADIINSQNYEEVICFDPHSDVSPALINNLAPQPISDFVCRIDRYLAKTWVSPDAGQLKKIYKLAQLVDFQGKIVTGSKVRDLNTGKIIRTEIDADRLDCDDCLIIDDLASYGGTFQALSRKLIEKGAGTVELFTTHNEMVFDDKVMRKAGISEIYSTDSIKKNDKYDSDYFTQFSIGF